MGKIFKITIVFFCSKIKICIKRNHKVNMISKSFIDDNTFHNEIHKNYEKY